MKKTFRLSMNWLHTWTGLVLSWLLFFMFLTGTLGYLDTEIDRWMQPEAVSKAIPTEQATELGLNYVKAHAYDAPIWGIQYPTTRDAPYLTIFSKPKGEGWQDVILDADTGTPVQVRDTAGGQTLYRMHWSLHYFPRIVAYYIVGIATMLMLIGLITGIIIHKKIFREFFTFRVKRGPASWLDIHNLFSVSALPFHLMITYSGLVFFTLIYMPGPPVFHFGWGPEAEETFQHQMFPHGPEPELSGTPGQLLDVQDFLAGIEAEFGEKSFSYMDVQLAGDANSMIQVYFPHGNPFEHKEPMAYSGTTGELVFDGQLESSAVGRVHHALIELHEGNYAGPVLRSLYILSGFAGTAMIATGLILWVLKRRSRELARPKGMSFGYRLVESLNLGTVIGLPMAVAVYFYANRLLPIDMEARAAWEIHCLFLVWLGAILHGLVRSRANSWIEQTWVAAAVFAGLPIVNGLMGVRGIFQPWAEDSGLFIAFDSAFIVIAGILVVVARYLAKKARAGEVKIAPVNAEQTGLGIDPKPGLPS